MPDSSPAVRTQDDLLAPFYEACKPREQWRIGTEAEKCGVYADGSAVHYEGDRGVRAVLGELARKGWEPHREVEGGAVLSLTRDGGSITLEPGAQLELSGAPLKTIHETKHEMDAHLDEVRAIGARFGITWLGLGFHPFARREDLEFVPKLRYGVMRKYLPTRGNMGLDMMLRTCTVQANLDYASEEDAIRKLRVSLRLSPIVGAMFANSPFVEKRITGERSHRTRVWLDVDPDRSGLLPSPGTTSRWASRATSTGSSTARCSCSSATITSCTTPDRRSARSCAMGSRARRRRRTTGSRT